MSKDGTQRAKKAPTAIDLNVGNRVRMRRIALGMSQEKLGSTIGVTFQQIQKYEKGTNRVSASSLQKIAQVLSVPVSFFYAGPEGDGGTAEGFSDNEQAPFGADLMTTEGLKLLKNFNLIPDPLVRRRVLDLVAVLGRSGAPVDKP